MEEQRLKRIHRLTQALLLSGALNIALLAFFFYWLVRDIPPRPYFESKPAEKEQQEVPLAIDRSNAEMVRSFKAIPFQQLIAQLTNTQQVENGFSKRDLALAALVAFHQFDLSRALLGLPQPAQQRSIPISRTHSGEINEVTLYPGLTENQFEAIVHFANTEKWPLTSKGLFQQLRKQAGQQDPSLADAFYLTPEFLAVEMLFSRSEVPVEKGELLTLLCQGDWSMISSFSEHQRIAQDLSPARRQRFLLDYLERESRAAAYLLLKTDKLFASKKLNDPHVLAILKLLVEKTPDAESYSLAMLTSPRSDQVWQIAAMRLYEYAGEPIPEKSLHHAALLRFVPQAVSGVKVVSKELPQNEIVVSPKMETAEPTKEKIKPRTRAKKSRVYVVQEGDSLWKIARRYRVDIDALKAYNQLDSDFLKPGTSIKIP